MISWMDCLKFTIVFVFCSGWIALLRIIGIQIFWSTFFDKLLANASKLTGWVLAHNKMVYDSRIDNEKERRSKDLVN